MLESTCKAVRHGTAYCSFKLQGQEIILIGTAHISKRSAEQVKEIIEAEKPDTVCVELDYQRYLALTRGAPSDPPDLRRLIAEKAPYALLSVLLGNAEAAGS